jgi:hypothetical protein
MPGSADGVISALGASLIVPACGDTPSLAQTPAETLARSGALREPLTVNEKILGVTRARQSQILRTRAQPESGAVIWPFRLWCTDGIDTPTLAAPPQSRPGRRVDAGMQGWPSRMSADHHWCGGYRTATLQARPITGPEVS